MDGIHSENFYPLIIAYPYNHPPEVFVMFDIQSHDFIGDDGILAMFEDDEAPLILGEGDWTDGRPFSTKTGKRCSNCPVFTSSGFAYLLSILNGYQIWRKLVPRKR